MVSFKPDRVETIQTEIKALAAQSIDLDTFGERLKPLYAEYEAKGDQQALAIIAENWELANAAVAATNTATNAVKLAQDFGELYEEAIIEYEEVVNELDCLTECLEDLEEGHPMVGAAVEQIRANVYEEVDDQMRTAQDRAYDDARVVTFEEVAENCERLLSLTRYNARRLAALLVNRFPGDGDRHLSEAKIAELGAAIAQVMEDYL